MENEWYIISNGQQVGPMNKMQLLNYGLRPDSQVWRPGMAGWSPASSIPELMAIIPANNMNTGAYGERPMEVMYGCPPNNYYQNGNMYNNGKMTDKSKVAAGVLALLLGGLGIQYFYCGKVGAGFITILLTLVTCGLWDIVTFIQGIMMLTMSDQEFEQKYVLTDKSFPLF